MPPSSQEELFERAIALPPADRSAWIAAACGLDVSLRRRLESLLRAHDEAQGFMESPPPDLGPAAPDFQIIAEEQPGDRIGRYKILQKIGEGGCGIVYMAEQEEAVRRRVAVKVIKLGMDTKAVIARFEAERQALARMEHPNIARVLDAGATDSGRPFFVMELVRGLRITDYCDQNNLSTEQRLNLFIRVCQAIQHAHQKGVIHRDIKPSNILVTLHDGEPVPKVIDFGIAKATQGRLTEQTLFTAFEQFIGTPAYVSPEQAEMSGLDVDTRSDLYSLGVLLYELLAGRTPFDTKELTEAGLDEMRRVIREQEPPRPSHRVRTLNDSDRTTVARRRGTEAQRLTLRLRGDLDWIVMRCLEKDRARRYETASALANDIQRHLENEPVAARPPSTTYLAAKLIRRHKLAFFAGATVVATLVLGFVVSTRALLSAQRNLDAQRQAEQKAAHALNIALAEKAAAERARENEERVRAEAQAGEAKAQRESARRAQVADFTNRMIRDLGELLVTVEGDTKVIQQVLKLTTTRLKLEAQRQPDLSEMVGRVYAAIGDPANAEQLMREALAMRRSLPNTDPNDLANTLNYLGLILLSQDKLEEAEESHNDALAILQRQPTANSERLISQLRANLGSVLAREGRFNDAKTFINDALARQRATGPESVDVAISTRALGVVLMQEGSLEESEETLLEALRLIRKNFPNDHPEVVSSYMSLAITLGSEFLNHPEKIRDAFVMFREADAIRQRLKNPGALPVAHVSADSVFEAQGSYAEVEVALKTMRRFMQRSYPAGSWDDAYFLAMTGYVQLFMKKYAEAEATARECYAMRAKLRPDDWSTFHAKNMIGAALAGQKKFAEAEPLLIEGYLGMKQQEARIPPFHLVRLTEGLQRIITCYTDWGKPEEVARWEAELKRVSQSKTAAN